MQIKDTFIANVEQSIITNWERPALTDYGSSTTLRYQDVACQIAKLHIVMREVGVRKGDKVAIYGRNSAHWVVVFFAVVTYGGVVVPIQNEFRAEQVHNIVNHSDTCLLFIGDGIDDKISFAAMPHLRGACAMAGFAALYSREKKFADVCANIDRLFAAQYADGLTAQDVHYSCETSPEEMALLNYTSGTTGFSKGVMIPYRSLWSNLFFTQTVLSKGIHPGDTLVSTLPMAHTFGMTCEILFGFVYGLHLYFLNRQPTPSIILTVCKEVRPAMLIAVPLVIEKVVQKSILPRLEKGSNHILYRLPLLNNIVKKRITQWINDELGGNIYQVFTGGASMNVDVERFLMDIAFPITSGYGCTETSPMITYSDHTDHVLGSCGTVVPNMELRIHKEHDSDETGEVVTRGMNLMIGYYKDPDRTAGAVDADGWFHTGDLGKMSSDGHLFLLGRIKNMLLGANGQNIYPEEIESKFDTLRLVGESLVLQEKHRLVALVYPDKEAIAALPSAVDLAAVMEENRCKVNRMLPKYSRISAVRLVDKPFERTTKKSIKRYLYTSE